MVHCLECKYWLKTDSENMVELTPGEFPVPGSREDFLGECHRHAFPGIWPSRSASEFCGDGEVSVKAYKLPKSLPSRGAFAVHTHADKIFRADCGACEEERSAGAGFPHPSTCPCVTCEEKYYGVFGNDPEI